MSDNPITPQGEHSVESFIADLRIRARNLERYPFDSATMAEGALMAANVLHNIIKEYEGESA